MLSVMYKSVKKRSQADRWITFRRKFLKGKKNWAGSYECEWCGAWAMYIDVHHIIKRSVAPDLVFEPSNLVLLCHNCHYHHHQKNGA